MGESRAVWETHGPQSPPDAPLLQPLSKGRKPKALTQKTLACLPSPIIQSPWRPVALSPGWADRLEGEVGEACRGRAGGTREANMEKSEQGLKNEEINLPGGRQRPSVLHKAVLGPPRTLADGGGRRWLLLGAQLGSSPHLVRGWQGGGPGDLEG